MEISIKNIIVTGIHGLTEKEKHTPQRFQIDLVMKTWTTTSVIDSVEHTVDYRESKKIIEEIMHGPHIDLIEILGEKIAKRIIKNKKIQSVTVRIKKLDIWDNGIPEIVIQKDAFHWTNLFDFDLGKVIEELLVRGGTSVPILSEQLRSALVQEAETYDYHKQPEIVGKYKVREQLSSFRDFPEQSLFLKLQYDFTDLLNYKLSQYHIKPFGVAPILFNEPVLQKYDKGSIGISPHMDGLSCLNLIIVFLIKGRGDVFLCDGRDGKNAYPLDTTLGNMTILRAPGFFGASKRPFHFLTNITEERITYGLRFNKKLT